jgi:hypothetical protein
VNSGNIQAQNRKPVYRAAGVHVAAHFFNQQQVIDCLLGVGNAAARDTRDVGAPVAPSENR